MEVNKKWLSEIFGVSVRTIQIKNFFSRKERLFEGFYSRHLPQPFLKSTFNEIWLREERLLKEASSKKFRAPLCVTQYLIRYWQLANGKFNPKSPQGRGMCFSLSSDNVNDAIRTLSDGTAQACFNDTEMLDDFDGVIHTLRNAFEQRLSNKSSFEV